MINFSQSQSWDEASSSSSNSCHLAWEHNRTFLSCSLTVGRNFMKMKQVIRKCYCPLHCFHSWHLYIKPAVRGLTYSQRVSFCQKIHQAWWKSCSPLITNFPWSPWDLEFSAFLETEHNHYQAEQDGIFSEIQWGPYLFRYMKRKHHFRRGSLIYAEF